MASDNSGNGAGDFFSVWRVNMRERTFTREPVPPTWERLGGRGLLARILVDEVPPDCDPLGPRNKLIFAPGLLVGHMLSSTDRISVGGTLTAHHGEQCRWANGSAATHRGIWALILEDQPGSRLCGCFT
jgi:aldehyde:ferredoxin oxidoreductase